MSNACSLVLETRRDVGRPDGPTIRGVRSISSQLFLPGADQFIQPGVSEAVDGGGGNTAAAASGGECITKNQPHFVKTSALVSTDLCFTRRLA